MEEALYLYDRSLTPLESLEEELRRYRGFQHMINDAEDNTLFFEIQDAFNATLKNQGS